LWPFALAGIALSACNDTRRTPPWQERADSTGYQEIVGMAEACTDCIDLDTVVTIGRDTVRGFLEDNGSIDYVVRDREGRYWVGQRTFIKVFAADGEFIQQVGKVGQGPMEFQFTQPVRVDPAGNVHVFDVRQGRETVIRPDFGHESDRLIPVGVNAVAAIPGDGHRYLISRWFATPELIGIPLHVIAGTDIQASFGLPAQTQGVEVTRAGSERVVATDSLGHLFSANLGKYRIEVWNATGARVAGFELPGLNEKESPPGSVWSDENPPWNHIVDIGPSGSDMLWVVTRQRKTDWRNNVTERVTSNGLPYLMPKDGLLSAAYRSRIDLLDLNKSAIVATHWHDGILLRFLEPGLLLRLDHTDM
jgi:hypothetical protein